MESLGLGFQMSNERPRSVNLMGPVLWVLGLCLLARQEGSICRQRSLDPALS